MSGSECVLCCYWGRNPCPRADYDPGGKCAGYVENIGNANFHVTNLPVNIGVDPAQPGTDKTVSWEPASDVARSEDKSVAQEDLGDGYLDDLIPASVDPEKNCTCVSCKHVMYGGGKTPRCRKFISAINAQFALCTQTRFWTKYCGGKLFERSE